MYCSSCGYQLIGLPPGACPECSHPFDPDDSSTWVERPVSPWMRAATGRWAGYVAITLTVFGAMWLKILPCPYIAWNGMIDARLWVWFDRPFGVERQRAMPEQLELSWWDGRLTGVRLRRIDPNGSSQNLAIAWDIRRRGDAWRLSVAQRGVPLGSVLLAYNSMRADDELFGLRLDDPNDTADATSRRSGLGSLNPEPFEASGRQEDVLSAILVAYSLDVRPLLTSRDDTDLWIFNKDEGRLERITVQEAEARGIQYSVAENFGVRRHRFSQ